MDSKVKEIRPWNSGRFGAIKNLGLSLRIAGFNSRTMPGIPESTYASSKEGRSHLIDVDCQKSRARTEAQRLQYNR